ncbi:Holliday junction resolvase RecU [Mycoplasma phocoenae]|uniref:Holliday junction resolvase RecU n=1 Tax=Mycoplasma phocoenae TaxID=754517 RepID=A0A858U6X8_9MOLU|nr:Holliday junction resolvase RecU [Mycoplasma phocoenae]QJG66983.1 Holliday junction resolvase RecU [Mycoplasma phocoenae]
MKNKGMLLESIINKSNDNYFRNQIAYVQKKNLDIKFKKVLKNSGNLTLEGANIFSKSTVDYYGIYNGKFLAFEAKECNESPLLFQNLKKHQMRYLELIEYFGGFAFYIILFKKESLFFLIKATDLHKFFQNKKSLKIEDCVEIGQQIDLIFPGILNYIDYLIN